MENKEEFVKKLVDLIYKLEDLFNTLPKREWMGSLEILETAVEIQKIFYDCGQSIHIIIAKNEAKIKLKIVTFPLYGKEEKFDLNNDKDFLKFLKENHIKLSDNLNSPT